VRSWREIVVSLLGGELKRSRSFTTEATIERSEELRPNRLGPTEDMLIQDDPEFTPPPDLWRPKTTLGPW
jgi:hypothetical protein